MPSWGDDMREIIRRHRTDPLIGKPRPEDAKRRRSGKVRLWTIMYDETHGEYVRTERRMAYDDLPPNAVEVAKMKNVWLLDAVSLQSEDEDGNPNGVTAASLNLWMVNNAINEALSGKWSPRLDMEQVKRLAVVGFVAVILIFSVYAII